uniref:Uncharacterized protein n=1 Tax=Rangifer tarandus platyrhynchus TaxID=3082113 RepID=A0ACB0E6V1_RANTA|nr:unnamed protein product [Rangifer tarandus platyrhynchus]
MSCAHGVRRSAASPSRRRPADRRHISASMLFLKPSQLPAALSLSRSPRDLGAGDRHSLAPLPRPQLHRLCWTPRERKVASDCGPRCPAIVASGQQEMERAVSQPDSLSRGSPCASASAFKLLLA